jgi:hypothetical protein
VHRYAKNGDAVLMLFDCEVDGKEFDRVELVRQTSGLAVRLPRCRARPRLILPYLRRAASWAAGGVEDMPLDEVA